MQRPPPVGPRFFGLLACLYLAQGLPSGLIAHALPALMRDSGASLGIIGLSGLLAFPWALKFLWAPFIDRYRTRRFWLLLFNAGSLALMLLLAARPLEAWFGGSLWPLFTVLVLINLCAATQDIATDGLAVSRLSERLRGIGNSIQVIGYKLGLICGGGVLLLLIDRWSWGAAYGGLCAVMALALLPVLFLRDDPVAAASRASEARMTLADYRAGFRSFLARPGMPACLLVVATFKIGDSLASSMIKPMLVDHGVPLGDIGLMSGVIGSIAGLAGALLGGALLLRLGHLAAMLGFGALQALGLGAFALVDLGFDNRGLLFFISGFEQFADGLSTVALFTLMMDACRRASPGADYTLLASTLVISTGIARLSSGFLTEGLGYVTVFTLAASLTLLALLPVRSYFQAGRA